MPESTRLTVRTHRDYRANFLVDVGQKDVEFVRGPVAPLQRLWSAGDAIAIVEPGSDILHTINAIPLKLPRRFIVTFEDYLPRTPECRRVPWLQKFQTHQLLSPRCEHIIAMSQYAMRQLEIQHANDGYLDDLLGKMSVQYPGVPIRASRPKDPDPRRPIRLLAVGRDWLVKGFPAVVEAHMELVRRGVQVETTIVSSLRWRSDDYVAPPSAGLCNKYLNELRSSGVNHIPCLGNDEVLQAMSEADLFIHPTLSDTFGYVLIESLAGSTPVIGTATCAVPEIISHDYCGMLLPMQTDPVTGEWAWMNRQKESGYIDAYEEFISDSAAAIVRHVEAFIASPDTLYRFSEAALQRARDRFELGILRAFLENIYRNPDIAAQ